MTIMYHTGEEWTYARFKRKETDLKAILVCGGPSLNKIDISSLRGAGKVIFGMNNTYPKVYPNIWLGMDDPSCYNRHLVYEPFMKIFRGGYHKRWTEDGKFLRDLYNVYFADVGNTTKDWFQIFDKINIKDKDTFTWTGNSFSIALNIIFYMGFKDIYLVGCDFSTEESHYHNTVELSKKELKHNNHLYKHLNKYLKWMYAQAKIHKINIYSASPLSMINDYLPFVTLEELNTSINLPPQGKLYHTTEIDKKSSKINNS